MSIEQVKEKIRKGQVPTYSELKNKDFKKSELFELLKWVKEWVNDSLNISKNKLPNKDYIIHELRTTLQRNTLVKRILDEVDNEIVPDFESLRFLTSDRLFELKTELQERGFDINPSKEEPYDVASHIYYVLKSNLASDDVSAAISLVANDQVPPLVSLQNMSKDDLEDLVDWLNENGIHVGEFKNIADPDSLKSLHRKISEQIGDRKASCRERV